jgi:uncharacterized protein (TIGR03000 family)
MSRSFFCVPLLAGFAALLLAPPLFAQADPGPAAEAYLTIKVPPDARVQIGDRLTRQTGELRKFVSPPLPIKTKGRYTYNIKVTYKAPDGKEVNDERTVEVTPGKNVELDLRKPATTEKPKTDTKPKTEDKSKEAGKTGTEKVASAPPRPADEEKPRRKPDVIFVPTPAEVVDEMLKMANVKKDDLLYDLGCGDGIIVVTAAKKIGCKTVGYDIDPQRVKEAKERAKKAGVEDLCTIEEKDIFTLDLSKASVITLYLLRELNEKLVPQLSKLKEGSRVVTHDFDIPGYKAEKETTLTVNGREHRVFLYTIPLKKDK